MLTLNFSNLKARHELIRARLAKIDSFVTARLAQLQSELRGEAEVETGFLRNSIEARIVQRSGSQLKAELVAKAPYAIFHKDDLQWEAKWSTFDRDVSGYLNSLMKR